MKISAPFERAGEHIAIDLPGARALFTTRHGGYSIGPYASLNLGRFTDDVPAAVERNRDALAKELAVNFVYGRQVHGAVVRRVLEPPDDFPYADGQATNAPGLAPLVLTADCLPITIATHGAVASVHAGWRGLDAGVIGEGVTAVRELGGDGPLEAAIGPGAGVCCYEVSDDVQARFEAFGPSVRHGENLDLKAIARAQLVEADVQVVHDVGLCTICGPDFFSHRRDRGMTGRQAGIAWLT